MGPRRLAACVAIAAAALAGSGCGVPIFGPAVIEVANDEASTMDVHRVVVVPSDEWAWEEDGDEDLWDDDEDDDEFDGWFTFWASWSTHADDRVDLAPGESETFALATGTYDVLVRWSDGREDVRSGVSVVAGFAETVTFHR